MKRTILAGIILALSVFLGVLAHHTVFAAGERWYWNGNDLQVMGGFFQDLGPQSFNSSNSQDTSRPEFAMNGNNTISIKRTCKGYPDHTIEQDLNPDGSCKEPGSNDDCIVSSTSTSSTMDCDSVLFTVNCNVKDLIVTVDKKNNTVSKARGSESTTVDKDKVHKNPGLIPQSAHKCANISYGTIQNARGDNAADTTLNESLEKEKQRLADEYIKQQCGDNPSPDCVNRTRDAFNTIFDSCQKSNDKMVVSDADTAKLKVEAIATCIQSATGLEMDNQDVIAGVLTVPDYEDEKSSCSLELIGWIVCPVVRFMGNLADHAFGALEKLLTIKPLNRGTAAGDSLFKAWVLMRDIANVMFVIAFMFVIYSQLTGMGIDNYGIKKLLPRIIVAALLVNASFYIAVIMVDLSNVVGNSLYTFLKGYADSLGPAVAFDTGEGGGWTKIVGNIVAATGIATAGAVIVTTAALYGAFSALVPLLTTVILALLTAIMILVGRYAFIIILIIVAPLAFVAYLLPNTQKWYNMWFKTFVGLLMLYPIIGLIYGGSYLAGLVVINSAGGRTGVQSNLLQLFGMSITAIPLLLTPIIMKFGGGVLNRFGGSVRSNGMFKKANQKADNFAERKKNQRDLRALQRFGDNKRGGIGGLRDRVIQRRYKRDAVRNIRGSELNKAQSRYISSYTASSDGSGGDKVSLLERAKAWERNYGNDASSADQYQPQTKGEKYAAGLAKGGDENSLNRAIGTALSDQMNIHYEDTATAKEAIMNGPNAIETARAIAKGQDTGHTSTATRQAALEIVGEQYDSDISDVAKHVGSMSGQERAAFAQSAQKNNKSLFYSNPTVNKTLMDGGMYDTSGNFTALNASTFHEQIVARSVNEGWITPARLADTDAQSIADISTAINDGHIDATRTQDVAKMAQQTLDNQYTRERLTDDTRAQLQSLASRATTSTP